MNRTVVAALAVATVLGTTGGVTLAALNGNRDKQQDPGAAARVKPSGTPTPTAAPSASVTPEATNEPLLYATNSEIHDGRSSEPRPTWPPSRPPG